MLSDSDSEDVEISHQLTVNEHYARAFAYKKEREELAKLKEKYGSDFEEEDLQDEESDSESDETEDEDGEELTPAVDVAVLRTLALIKNKDPGIYNSSKKIFEDETKRSTPFNSQKKHTKKEKPLLYKQQAFDAMLNDYEDVALPSKTHVEEQAELRTEMISAFHQALPEDTAPDDLLVLRDKTQDEIEKEEEEYRQYLQREVGNIKNVVWADETPSNIVDHAENLPKETERTSKGKQKAQAPKVTDQEFLLNYILNRGWIDRSARRLPTHEEITSKPKGKRQKEIKSPQGDRSGEEESSEGEGSVIAIPDPQNGLASDSDFDDVADNFEASYNFRFEEPGGVQISRHPRNITSLVRRTDTTRKDARQRKKERKEEALREKKEEVRRMKGLKAKEIRERLEKLGQEGGWETAALVDLDLDGDWDPEKHDQKMAELYADEAVDGEEVEKPNWDDDIDISHMEPGPSALPKRRKKKKADAPEDPSVDISDMDADIATKRVVDSEEWDGTEEMRKRKLDEYMEEIYGMDFNDMAGGMPTRFSYAKVAPSSFALTPAEILMATDGELKAYMSMKKFATYRKSKEWDKTRPERLRELKEAIAKRSGAAGGILDTAGAEPELGRKKRKGKKERAKAKDGAEVPAGQLISEEGNPGPKRKRRKKSKVGE